MEWKCFWCISMPFLIDMLCGCISCSLNFTKFWKCNSKMCKIQNNIQQTTVSSCALVSRGSQQVCKLLFLEMPYLQLCVFTPCKGMIPTMSNAEYRFFFLSSFWGKLRTLSTSSFLFNWWSFTVNNRITLGQAGNGSVFKVNHRIIWRAG